MKRTFIELRFSDSEMAQLLADAKPRKGIRVSKPQTFIQASLPAEIGSHVLIDFSVQLSVLLVGAWILSALKKSGKKRTRINRRETPLQKREIVRLIKRELANQRRREAQWREVHNKKAESSKGG